MKTVSCSSCLLLCLALMAAAESASWRDWYQEEPLELPAFTWNRAARSRTRSCSATGQRCDGANLCCHRSDVCLTSPQTDADGLRSTRCVNWFEASPRIQKLPSGADCTDSWQCADRCCREHRAHRHDIVLVCGTPFDGIEWHTCITESS